MSTNSTPYKKMLQQIVSKIYKNISYYRLYPSNYNIVINRVNNLQNNMSANSTLSLYNDILTNCQ